MGQEEKNKAERNKRRREVRNNNPEESEFLMTGVRDVETVRNKLPERGAMTPVPCDESKTMATTTSKGKKKEKVKVTRQKRAPSCGCMGAVGNK